MKQSAVDNLNEPPSPKTVVLLLLDGWGIAPAGEANAISLSSTPNFNQLIKDYPVTLLRVKKKSLNARYLSLGAGKHLVDENIQISDSLSAIISQAGLKQLKITESNRLAALTYFFNGGREEKYSGEEWQIISAQESDKLKPDRIIDKIRQELEAALSSQEFSFIVVSIPSLDLISQDGEIADVKRAVEVVDKNLGRIFNLALNNAAKLIISAACGNAEHLKNMATELDDKEMTDNPVPLIIAGQGLDGKTFGLKESVSGDLSLLAPIGGLDDLAPTILEIMDLKIPAKMTGKSLIDKKLNWNNLE